MKPRMKRTVEPIETPDGDLILMRTCAADIRVEQPDPAERSLLLALDGSRTVTELEERFGAVEVGDAIAQMQELHLLEDGADDDLVPAAERERFDRQLRYFADLQAIDGPPPSQCQERLRDSRVAILGVGGLGGRVALELACCGVGELWLADGDTVETSNLNRQIQFQESDLGRSKVTATAERLRAFNSAIEVRCRTERIESQSDLREYIAGADIVVDAADWPAHEIERWCDSACFASGIPYIAMSQYPPIVRVGPLYVPGRTGCFHCQEIAFRREYPLYDTAIEQRRGKSPPAATFGPACGLIGGIVAAEIVHHLTDLTVPATLGAGYEFDLRTLNVRRYEVAPDPECPVFEEHSRLAVSR